MNLLKTNRSPFRLIALMAILFAILFVTFFPGIEETRSEFRIRHAYNTVCRLAKSETALIEHQAANTEDQNDPWGNPYGIAELAEGTRVISWGPNGISPATGFDRDDIYSDMTYSPSEAMFQSKQRKLIFCLSLPVVWLLGSIGYFFACKKPRTSP